MFRRVRVPSEREVLSAIYRMYIDKYPREGNENNEALVAIDLDAVARKLQVGPEFLFQYLVMMDLKYRYKSGENAFRHLYTRRFGEREHGVSLPYAAAVLAVHNQEFSRFTLTLVISIAAAVIAVAGVVVQYLGGR